MNTGEFNLSHTFVDAETTHISGITTYDESGTDIPVVVMYNNYTAPSDNYNGIRCRNTGATQTIEMFIGSAISSAVNIASWGSSLFTSYYNQTFSGNTGVLEKSLNLTASTSGNYTMTSANSFLTTLNTPSANRNFILPAVSPGIGYWYGICNRSTAFTIAVQFPSGTTIFTIPVATNATNGGSFAKFAVNSAGTAYFRCG